MVIRTDWLEILEDVFSKYTRNSFQGMQHKVNAPLEPHLKPNSAPLHRREFASNVDKRKKKKTFPGVKRNRRTTYFSCKKMHKSQKPYNQLAQCKKALK